MNHVDLKTIKLSLYRSCFEAAPINEISLATWLFSESHFRQLVDRIRNENDKITRDKMKVQLPAVTIGGVFRGRRLESIQRDSGLICVDIDGKDNPQITDWEVLKTGLSRLPYILYCGLSVSGNGLMGIIQLMYLDRFLSQYYALEAEFLSMGIVIDKKCKDKNHLRFYSYDANCYLNTSALKYEKCMDGSALQNVHIPSKVEKSIQYNPVSINNEKHGLEYTEYDFLSPMNLNRKYIVLFRNGDQLRIYQLLKQALAKNIDITAVYDDWITICYILIKYFDAADAIDLFLEICSQYPRFDEDECIRKYRECIKDDRYNYSARRFYAICERYGMAVN